jgi:phosphotransferase system HPr-like phosphotransfer protein
MTLDVKHGDEIVVRIEGELEVETSKKLKALVESSGH